MSGISTRRQYPPHSLFMAGQICRVFNLRLPFDGKIAPNMYHFDTMTQARDERLALLSDGTGSFHDRLGIMGHSSPSDL